MAKYGHTSFSIFGKLLAVPRLETAGENYKYAVMEMEVITRNPKDKTDKTDKTDKVQIVSVKAQMYDAESIAKYGKRDAFYYVSGSVNSKEYTDRNGITRYATELVATKICGG